MKLALALGIALCTFSSVARSGELVGTIREGTHLVGKGIRVEVISARDTVHTETDAYGSYRLFVPAKGKCTLVLTYNGKQVQMVIHSYSTTTRFDLVLTRESDGTYSLKRM